MKTISGGHFYTSVNSPIEVNCNLTYIITATFKPIEEVIFSSWMWKWNCNRIKRQKLGEETIRDVCVGTTSEGLLKERLFTRDGRSAIISFSLYFAWLLLCAIPFGSVGTGIGCPSLLVFLSLSFSLIKVTCEWKNVISHYSLHCYFSQ